MSDLREAEVEDVGVQFAQSSGEAISAQILSTEFTEDQNTHEIRHIERSS